MSTHDERIALIRNVALGVTQNWSMFEYALQQEGIWIGWDFDANHWVLYARQNGPGFVEIDETSSKTAEGIAWLALEYIQKHSTSG